MTPSSDEVTSVFSTLMASAIPTLPSSPAADFALVKFLSTALASKSKLPPAVILAVSPTTALTSELITLTAMAAATPLPSRVFSLPPMVIFLSSPATSAIALTTFSASAFSEISLVALMVPSTVKVASVFTILRAPPNNHAKGSDSAAPLAVAEAEKLSAFIVAPERISTFALDVEIATPAIRLN